MARCNALEVTMLQYAIRLEVETLQLMSHLYQGLLTCFLVPFELHVTTSPLKLFDTLSQEEHWHNTMLTKILVWQILCHRLIGRFWFYISSNTSHIPDTLATLADTIFMRWDIGPYLIWRLPLWVLLFPLHRWRTWKCFIKCILTILLQTTLHNSFYRFVYYKCHPSTFEMNGKYEVITCWSEQNTSSDISAPPY